ncbi:MAG: hypothetical protein CSA76_01390 [Spirochaetales bacterium]|nr:MAG: hypothetical protein CSA76_01390 [Spirochaetales bacterium]
MKLKGVLASDLDGTIAVKGVIGAGEFRAAEKLRLAGIPLLVVTGRNSLSLQWVDGLRELADEILFSSGAGLQVASEALPRELHWLSAGEVQRIAGILNDFGEDYCILHRIPRSGNFSWVRRRPENADLDSRLKLYARWAKPLPPGGVARAFPEGAVHILVIRPSFPAPDSDLISALSEWSVFTGTSPLDHSSAWLEIFPAGVNKGGALSEWCARRGLSAGSVMALGNDYILPEREVLPLPWRRLWLCLEPAGSGRAVRARPRPSVSPRLGYKERPGSRRSESPHPSGSPRPQSAAL